MFIALDWLRASRSDIRKEFRLFILIAIILGVILLGIILVILLVYEEIEIDIEEARGKRHRVHGHTQGRGRRRSSSSTTGVPRLPDEKETVRGQRGQRNALEVHGRHLGDVDRHG